MRADYKGEGGIFALLALLGGKDPRIYPMIQTLRSLRWWVEPFTLVACALLIVTTGLAHGSAGVGKSVLVLYGERGDLPAIQAIEEALLSAVAQALARSAENWQTHDVVAQIRTRIATLTPREYEVFRLVIAGLSTNRSPRNSAPRYGR